MRRYPTLLLALLVVAACRSTPPPPPAPTPDPAARRSPPAGEVVGFVGEHGSFVWLGLPYAAPPVGDLRWRSPEPPAPWQGVREAVRPGNPCVQYTTPFGGVEGTGPDMPTGDEDCLTLDVYAPKSATPTSFLPVMVWIHGGGNTVGTGTRYDGGDLAARQNVVVVTLNYRLGPFGWFRHAAIRADSSSDLERSGNFAVLDLVRALEWVGSNVTAFGGDPAKVTIFGESAGGTNTLALLLSPQAIGLFHRAIIQSGGLRLFDPVVAEAFHESPTPVTRNSSNEAVARMLVASGTARDRADAKAKIIATPRVELAQRLRALPARDVLAAYDTLKGTGMILMPTVFRDDTVLPTGAYLDNFRNADRWSQVPVMLGTNRDENKLFMVTSPVWVKRWLGFLPRFVDEANYDPVADTLARMWKATGADELATAMVASGARDVYVYRFDWDEQPTILGTDLSRMVGAAHGIEIPFVFGHFDLGREGRRFFTAENEPGRRDLSNAMMAYWAEFARTGRPGRGDGSRPEWPAWSAAKPEYIVFDTPAGGGITRSSEVQTRDGVLAGIERDPRLAGPRERCLVYHDLVMWSPSLTREAYDAKCKDFPFDGYPWRS